jgi:uncharacterized RDD family membrane protein YckC
MDQTNISNALPDPAFQSEFYRDIPTKRLVAWIADVIVIFLITVLLVPLTAFTAIFYFPFLFAAVSFVYRVATIASGSATWGMRFVAIELRSREGARFDLSLALLHTIGYAISVSMVFVQIISVILMLTSARKQGLTDMIMGSVVINRAAQS